MTRAGLRYFPVLMLAVFLAPIGAGLVGTLLPAFGYLPAAGGADFGLAAWRDLFDAPGLRRSVRLTLTTGVTATAISLGLVFAFCAAAHDKRFFMRARQVLGPVLAVPHAAVAIGLAFLITPSGWLVRLISPGLTGWDRPPDFLAIQDPLGLALIAGLVLKEMPFLLLMTIGALGQPTVQPTLTVARSLGYGPVHAWLKCVLPGVYRQVRLPVYAVLAFSLSVVDMALILAPSTPPPLAVQVFRWVRDPDLDMQFQAAAGACLQLLLVGAAIASWALAERLVAVLGRGWMVAGGRGGSGNAASAITSGGLGLVLGGGALSILAMGIWSVAQRWRYPHFLPTSWTLDNWSRQFGSLAWPAWVTVVVGLMSALLALALVLGCLENERRRGVDASTKVMWLIYLPLLLPQMGFLFGVQILLVKVGLDGKMIALIWAHMLFVLPYVYLALVDPYRALDERYGRTGLVLGASPARVFLAITLPMLLRPILLALALGVAVSVALYLPTIFAGGGRFATLTTEAVSLAAGADRRVTGVYVLLQSALPLLAFAIALGVPAWLYRDRQALQVAQ
ncbi:MAG: ABC transporter permease [Alphaproteobacteria bacterium]